MTTTPVTTLDQARALFPHTTQGKLYLNHAATSPLSNRVVQAMTSHLAERSEGRIETYPADIRMVGECRDLITRLVHAGSPDRIALTANTSDAINIVAGGVPLQPGDRVVVGHFEFPANVWPYLNLRRKGIAVDFLHSDKGRVTIDAVERMITPDTRLLAVSAVQFLSGHRTDLASLGNLCRDRNIWFVVDGIQAVGAVDIDVRALGIHALAAGGQKWQNAPHGNGFLYVSEELQEALQPASLGWLAVEDPWQFSDYDQPVATTARRFEGGSLNMPGLWGYHAALSTLIEFGLPAIESRVRGLTRLLIDRFSEIPGVDIFTPTDDDQHAGIVTIRPGNADAAVVFKRLLKRNVTVALREGMLRFSPHFYNTDQEIERAIDLFHETISQP